MDDKWFKAQQKRAGKTTADIAAALGRSRTIVSHIYHGKQRMSLEWAQAFAKVLDVPLADVLQRAGVMDQERPADKPSGLSDGDASPWTGKPPATPDQMQARATPGQDVWRVNSSAMSLHGYMPGDFLLVDSSKSELARPDDVVIAQIYNWQQGYATTVLRRYAPPVLISACADPAVARVHVVDGDNVVIKGKVISSWRINAT